MTKHEAKYKKLSDEGHAKESEAVLAKQPSEVNNLLRIVGRIKLH